MPKKLFIFFQYILPQHLLSRFVGWAAERRWKWFKNIFINCFIRYYKVDMRIASTDRLEDYPTFNAFFTRALKHRARPIASEKDVLISPVDGCISQIGQIEKDTLLQAKGILYSVDALLGVPSPHFIDGHFVTFYLAPKDYHRVHMPFSGKLTHTIYIPGKLFSVNTSSTEMIPHLFTRNERLVCLFDTEVGSMAVILIGAMLVGKIQTVWGLVERSQRVVTRRYSDHENIYLEKGDELGRFNMGSSVIVLFEKNRTQWLATLQEQTSVQMGQAIGTCIRSFSQV